MIITVLEDALEQAALTPNLVKAFRFLQKTDLDRIPEGKHLIDGERVYALVSSYTTKTVSSLVKLEGHYRYIDIQYLAAGQELIAWAPMDSVPVSTPYQEEFDFWEGVLPATEISQVRLSAGMLAVLFPHDAHAPQLAVGIPLNVRKIVLKVACESSAP